MNSRPSLEPHALHVARSAICARVAAAGVGLYVGVLLLVWFLLALSGDATSYGHFTGFIRSLIGRLVLFGFTWSLFHHMLGGVRHALWDAGIGLDHPLRERLAQITLIGGFALSVVAWIVGYAVR